MDSVDTNAGFPLPLVNERASVGMQTGTSTRQTLAADPVAKFNSMQGKLRISLTHACQLKCKFCHQEGIEPHWKPVHIPLEYFQAVLDAYSRIGGRYVELTGGEPLLHPRISDLVRLASAPRRHVTVCTNGLRLERILSELRNGYVQLVKLSLHATANSSDAGWLLGRGWDFERVSENISRVIDTGTRIQLLYTLTQRNAANLPKLLDLSLKWGVDLQLVDLIPARNKDSTPLLGYLGGEVLEEQVRTRAYFERVVSDRTGATLKIYRTKEGAIWELKDAHYGLFHSRMCDGCHVRSICGEGVYALRVDAAGTFKPCLLRQDLDVKTSTSPGDAEHITSTIGNLIGIMMKEN
jgi:GTP 3',8-cyclase